MRRTSEDEHAQAVDDLFFDYARIIRGLQPRAFVAENVSGLVKGTAKGYFKLILRELKSCGYRVQARLLDAQWLGVPQMRQRIIFVGVREDLGLDPAFPKPLPYRYGVREAVPWISRHGTSMDLNDWRQNPDPARTMVHSVTRPAPTVTTESGMAGAGFVEAERVRIVNDHHGQFNDSDITIDSPSPGIIADGHGKLRIIHDTGGFVRNKDITDRPCPTVTVGVNSLNS